ncbi:MAG: sigma-70 family RNA polymerase sigma factor [Gemmatimonas sp.]|nr:sigma-70 family RNA polymerase sigma factor [Gemmatimonas sp.]
MQIQVRSRLNTPLPPDSSVEMASQSSSVRMKSVTDQRQRILSATADPGQLRLMRSADDSGFRSAGAGEKPVSPDPERLMKEVRRGDRNAFKELVETLWAQTLRYACQLTGGDADHAHDITQVAFTRLWEARETMTEAAAVRVWLLRTARNLAVNEHRSSTARVRWHRGSADMSHSPRTPLEETEGSELRADINQAISRLSPRRRESFTLCHLEGLTYREAAEVMAIRQQSVANYLQAAVAELRESLAPFYRAGPSKPDERSRQQFPGDRSR